MTRRARRPGPAGSLRALCLAGALLGGCDAEPCRPRARLVDDRGAGGWTCVAVLESEADRRQGLVGVPAGGDQGAVLIFPVTGEVCIHNAAVAFDIDVFYIGAGFGVVARELNVAADDATLRCHEGVRYVFEAPAGDQLAGDRLQLDR